MILMKAELKMQLYTREMNLEFLLTYFKGLSESQKVLLSQVVKLASLLVVLPATNAVSKRSFSSLRRVKTYLRATMTQRS